MIIIDYHWSSLVIINYHWLSLIIINYLWLSLMFIDYHELSVISVMIIDYHWLSLIIIDYLNMCIYGLVFRVPTPPQWYGSPGSTPFLSICKLLAAFLRSSLVFYLLGFCSDSDYQPSHLLGTCYLLDDLCSTPTCCL